VGEFHFYWFIEPATNLSIGFGNINHLLLSSTPYRGFITIYFYSNKFGVKNSE